LAMLGNDWQWLAMFGNDWQWLLWLPSAFFPLQLYMFIRFIMYWYVSSRIQYVKGRIIQDVKMMVDVKHLIINSIYHLIKTSFYRDYYLFIFSKYSQIGHPLDRFLCDKIHLRFIGHNHFILFSLNSSINSYYLSVLQKSYSRSTTIHLSDRCSPISELFNETFVQLHLLPETDMGQFFVTRPDPRLKIFLLTRPEVENFLLARPDPTRPELNYSF
jgi:hypothetical protein